MIEPFSHCSFLLLSSLFSFLSGGEASRFFGRGVKPAAWGFQGGRSFPGDFSVIPACTDHGG